MSDSNSKIGPPDHPVFDLKDPMLAQTSSILIYAFSDIDSKRVTLATMII